MIELDYSPDYRKLRSFAWISTLVFAGLATVCYWREHSNLLCVSAGILSLYSLLCGCASPKWIKPLYVGLMVLAFPIGWVVSHVFLLMMFFGVFFPIGLVMKAIGKDPIVRGGDAGRTSNWESRTRNRSKRHYYEQF